jgi:hypothetical protein
MNSYRTLLLSLLMSLCIPLTAFTQPDWPKEIPLANGGRIILYQLQPEGFTGNSLTARAAVSIRKQAGDEPVFGAIWITALLETDKDERLATLENIQITQARFPDSKDQPQANNYLSLLQQEIPKWHLDILLDELIATMDGARQMENDSFRNDPPEIIYAQQPSMLVLIDGEPIIQADKQLDLNRVINTPFLIVQNPADGLYYLYGDHFWYRSTSVTAGWAPVSKLPVAIKRIDKQIKKQAQEQDDHKLAHIDIHRAIIIRITPAELIQTVGEAELAPIKGTNLLYVTNTHDNLFLDIFRQQYYTVLSGRWYKAPALKGPWTYVPSGSLPVDFALIPEGSEKDEVLAYVPGTEAAREAVMDAQIPQTAKVDRRKATCQVRYDGEPRFESIAGTNLQVAVNASNTVLRSQNKYYCVENGVWFMASQATGPWSVSVERPAEVEKIPPSHPAYQVKYVYIYDSMPDYVYMGYTAGYLGCYVYGPTIIYGTGYHYHRWYSNVYFARPHTWGFGMYYTPWTGWNIGFNMAWLDFPVISWPYFWGWWGPPRYRPPYRPPYLRERSYYGDHHYSSYPNRSPRSIHISSSQNLYHYRNDVVTREPERRESRGGNESLPGTSNKRPTRVKEQVAPTPSIDQKPRPNKALDILNNVYSDHSGNTYQRDREGNWQQRDGQNWKPAKQERNPSIPQIQRDHTLRERATDRVKNFQHQQPRIISSPRPATQPKPTIPSRSPRAKLPGKSN